MVQNVCISYNPSPKTKKDGGGGIIASREDDQDYVQDRDKRHSDSYRYNSDYLRMFDFIGIIKLDAYHNKALSGVSKATREKIWGSIKGG